MSSHVSKNYFFLFSLSILSFAVPAFAASDRAAIERLEQQLRTIQETDQFNKQRLAEALASFDSIRLEITTLRGEIEKMQHTVEQAETARQQHVTEVEMRLGRMEERLNEMDTLVKDVGSTAAAPEAGKGGKTAAAEKQLYDEAMSEVTHKNYRQGLVLFEKFLKTYPKSQLADNAQYWQGESLFALGDYEKAILAFQNVIKKYPKGNKVAAAKLKQGSAFMKLKAYADAKAFFEMVIAEHPGTPEAVQAKERIVEANRYLNK